MIAMGKYDALGKFLAKQFGSEIPMTFAEIESVTGVKLPPKAQHHRAWWSNNPSNNVMTKVWLDAGFRTEQVDMASRKLVFARKSRREKGMAESSRGYDPPERKVARHPAIGALKGMFTIDPGYDIASSDPEAVAEWEGAADRTAEMYEAGRTKK